MTSKCSLPDCDRPSQGLCLGCQTQFCAEHMVEHNLAIHLQLNPLVDRANDINNRLRSLDTRMLLNKSFQEIENWRIQSHELIDAFCLERSKTLERNILAKIDECDKDLRAIQAKIIVYMRELQTSHEQVDELTSEIRNLQRDFQRIIDKDFQMFITRLNIDSKQIYFGEEIRMDSLTPPYRSMNRDAKSYSCLATDGDYLLVHRDGTLLLVDDKTNQIDAIPWKFGTIFDTCFSATLERYVILTEHEVYLLDMKQLRITKVKSIPWQEWYTCTCSRNTLYLTTRVYSSSIMEFALPSMHFIKRWELSDIGEKDDVIDHVVYRHKALALLIKNNLKKTVRLELRTVEMMDRIWSLPLYVIYNPKSAMHFCSLNPEEWLIANRDDSQLLHISPEGQIHTTISYSPAPERVIVLGRRTLVVLTSKWIYFHKL